jgi:hypothetical protein
MHYKTFCDLNLNHLCNISQNVDTTFIVNSVMLRLFDKHINDWHNCLSLERSVSGRGGNKLRTYRLSSIKSLQKQQIHSSIL